MDKMLKIIKISQNLLFINSLAYLFYMSSIELVTISSRGQLVLPKATRKKLGIKKGEKMVLIEKEGKLIISKTTNMEAMLTKGLETFVLSEKSLAKDWDSEEDNVWDSI